MQWLPSESRLTRIHFLKASTMILLHPPSLVGNVTTRSNATRALDHSLLAQYIKPHVKSYSSTIELLSNVVSPVDFEIYKGGGNSRSHRY